MQLFTIAKGFNKAEEDARESEQLKTEADSFQIAGNGGYIVALKYALFALFGFYNVRLFITTVLGWEGYLTAAFALAMLRRVDAALGAHVVLVGRTVAEA